MRLGVQQTVRCMALFSDTVGHKSLRRAGTARTRRPPDKAQIARACVWGVAHIRSVCSVCSVRPYREQISTHSAGSPASTTGRR